MRFDSYHWRGATLGSTELEHARELVSAKQDLASFELLLRSGDIAAAGVALDQYQYGEAQSRWGTANPFARYSDEVAARARAILRQPPSPASDRVCPGASHASALNALSNLIMPDDAALVVRALAQSATPDLRAAATAAAGRVLEMSVNPNEQLVAELAKIVLDESLVLEERIDAVSSLSSASSQQATDALLRVLQLPGIKLQAHAALRLLDRDEGAYWDAVRRIAQTWPADPPYPADEVLEELDAMSSK